MQNHDWDFNFAPASSKGSDEPVYLKSLTRAFVVRIHIIWWQMKAKAKYRPISSPTKA